MPAIKDLGQAGAKWKRMAAAATPEYKFGVEHPRKDWATETKAAEGAYEAGIAASLADKRFGKGVDRAGTSKWQQGAIEKGVSRWAQGVGVSQAAYEQGVKPYFDVISRITLPKRGPKGDPNNIQRVAILAEALHAEKLKRS